MPKSTPQNRIPRWEKEFNEEFSGCVPLYPVWGNIIDFIRQTRQKAIQETLGGLKSGKICLSCGGKKEGQLTDWCDRCLEEG